MRPVFSYISHSQEVIDGEASPLFGGQVGFGDQVDFDIRAFEVFVEELVAEFDHSRLVECGAAVAAAGEFLQEDVYALREVTVFVIPV